MRNSCINNNTLPKMTLGQFCNECHHPCHCGEDNELHADEYGVCTCEGCKCKDSKIEKKDED